jgi:hypothetical protein
VKRANPPAGKNNVGCHAVRVNENRKIGGWRRKAVFSWFIPDGILIPFSKNNDFKRCRAQAIHLFIQDPRDVKDD